MSGWRQLCCASSRPSLASGGGNDPGDARAGPQFRSDRAVGLLTQRDLDVLGTGFRRSFPVHQDTQFDDLLLALDSIEAMDVPRKSR